MEWVGIYVYIYIYLCMYIYIYIYIYTHTSSAKAISGTLHMSIETYSEEKSPVNEACSHFVIQGGPCLWPFTRYILLTLPPPLLWVLYRNCIWNSLHRAA